MARHHTPEVKAKFLELRAKGATVAEAAKELKVKFETAKDWSESPEKKAFDEQLKARLQEKAIAGALPTREECLKLWWEHAQIDPSETGYKTNSQDAALKMVWDGMGYDQPPKTQTPAEDEPDIFVPKWMQRQVTQ
jgi:hypothetical protein